MKRLIVSLGILSFFIPLTTQALVLPGVTRQRPGHYQMLSTDKIDTRTFLQRQAGSSSSVSAVVYRSIPLNLAFSYPNNWELLDSVTFIALWPKDDGNSLKTQRNSAIRLDAISLRTSTDYTDVQLDNYFKSFVTLTNQSSPLHDYYVPSFHLINASGATLLGHHARLYAYTGEVRSVKEKMMLVLATMNQKLYGVYYHSSPETFDIDRPVFDALLRSLQWNTPTSGSASSKGSMRMRSSASSAANSRNVHR